MTPGSGRHNPLYLEKLRNVGSTLAAESAQICGMPGWPRTTKENLHHAKTY
jgi:hypothetical protein